MRQANILSSIRFAPPEAIAPPVNDELSKGKSRIPAGHVVKTSWEVPCTSAKLPEPGWHGADSFADRAADASASSAVATVALTLAGVNDVPGAVGGSFDVFDNAPIGTIVGSVVADDVDADSLSYTIADGNAGDSFAIDGAGQITVATAGLDYRVTPEWRLMVTVSDPHGGIATVEVVVRLRPLSVGIDIDPGDPSNALSLKRHRVFSVAILSTAGFDATAIDVSSLSFGRTGDETSLYVWKGSSRFEYRDVNGDGLPDLVVEFDLTKTNLNQSDTTATLKGRLLDGTDFVGSDAVSMTA